MDNSNYQISHLVDHFKSQGESVQLLHLYYYNELPSRYDINDFFTKNETLEEIKKELIKMGFDYVKDSWNARISNLAEKDSRLKRQCFHFKNDERKITLRVYTDFVGILYSDMKSFKYISNDLVPFFKKFHIDIKEKPVLKMLIESQHGIEVTDFDTKEQVLDLDNYNDDFVNANDKISAFMTDENRSGLVLLHGTPGTGKTSYIRSLISTYRKNSFIYIPNDMIEVIVRPDFLPIIARNPKSVLILEDCERLITNRDVSSATMGVSNILNMTDGLLSDCLKMKIIATFNCDVDKIDKALRRPGRLVYEYEFGYLSHDKVKNLFKKYKIKKEINSDKQYTLADIYSDTETGFTLPTKQSFGFSVPSDEDRDKERINSIISTIKS